MTKFQILTLSAIAIGLCVPKIAYAEGDAELIKNAESAAPAALSSGAAVYAPRDDKEGGADEDADIWN